MPRHGRFGSGERLLASIGGSRTATCLRSQAKGKKPGNGGPPFYAIAEKLR
jgi:hypothetical protein